jgi:hypothetical protein
VALFVGISKYSSNDIRQLKCSHLDAIKMAEVMKKHCALDRAIVLTDEKATHARIDATFRQELVEKTKPGDFVVVYWSGHGGRCVNSFSDDPETYLAYLVPHDGSMADRWDESRTMLLDQTFARWVQALDGRKVVVILDTVHSGGHLKSIRNAAVLAAATFKQLAFERRESDLGVMTYSLVEKLQDGKGPLTLKDLADYVRPRVKKYVEDQFVGARQDVEFKEQDGIRPALVRK